MNQIKLKVALCGGVKEITGKWEFSLEIWQLLYELSPAKNLKKSSDERLYRQVAEDWRVSFSSDEEASWFHFHFVLTFWHACAFNNIRYDHIFARFHHHTTQSPHHHDHHQISRVTDQQGKALIARLVSRGHVGVGPGRPFTAQDSSAASGRMGQSLEMVLMVLVLMFSWLHSWLGTGGWWWHGVVSLDRSARFFHIYCNVTSRQRLYLGTSRVGNYFAGVFEIRQASRLTTSIKQNPKRFLRDRSRVVRNTSDCLGAESRWLVGEDRESQSEPRDDRGPALGKLVVYCFRACCV